MALKIRRKTFRKKIKEPDEFISFNQRALQYVKENFRTIAVVFTVALVIILSTGFFIKRSRDQKKAFFYKTYEEIMLANRSFNDNKYKDASELFVEIIEQNNKSSLFNEVAQVGLGYSLMESKNYDKSIKIFEDLIARDDFQYPKEELYKNIAILYKKTGKLNKAVEVYRKLMELFPDSIDFSSYHNKIFKIFIRE